MEKIKDTEIMSDFIDRSRSIREEFLAVKRSRLKEGTSVGHTSQDLNIVGDLMEEGGDVAGTGKVLKDGDTG